MDDIYFSDRRRRQNDDKDKSAPRDRFSQSDRFDLQESPALKKRGNEAQDKKNDFDVRLPDDFDVYRDTPKNRTPRAPRVSSEIPPSKRASQPPVQKRTPTGQRIQHSAQGSYIPPERRSPQPPSRTPQGSAMNEKKKKKVGVIVALSLLLVLLVGIAGLFLYGYIALGSIDYDDTITENSYIDKGELASSPDVKNILIIGSDVRAEGSAEHALVSGQRADSMILFSIDSKNKQIKLTSFLRDSYVYIPSVGYEDKLNAAYSLGGAQLTMDTLEYNFGVKIDSYLTINFEVFKQFINLIGGVPVEVTEYEADYMVDELEYIYIKPGVNVMNGNAALMYCRMRYLDNDFNRTQRQRKVIKSVVGKIAKTNLFKLMDIVKQVVPNIRTDISRNELISLGAGAAVKFLHYDIVQQQMPAPGTWWDQSVPGSGDVIVFNMETNSEILHEFIFEKVTEEKEEE